MMLLPKSYVNVSFYANYLMSTRYVNFKCLQLVISDAGIISDACDLSHGIACYPNRKWAGVVSVK